MSCPFLPPYNRFVKPLLLFMVLVVFVGHLYNYCTKNACPVPFEYGLYGWEQWGGKNDKRKMRWTGKAACQPTRAETDILGLTVYAAPHNIDERGVELTIYMNETLLDTVHFMESGSRPLYYYLPGIAGRDMTLKMKVSKTFNPSKLGINKDTRDLGVAVSPVAFLRIMPVEGVGFHAWESTGRFSDDLPPRFRWTGMRASLNVQREFKKGVTLFLLCAHPDIDQEPVTVDIMSDRDLIRRETFSDHSWKQLVITPEELKDSTALTFQVSRTWNPQLEGISTDSRNMGVAVGLKPFRPTH